jgi:molybdate transport system substrate-binding protein
LKHALRLRLVFAITRPVGAAFIAVLLGAIATPSSARAEKMFIRIAAAADLKFALEEAAHAYQTTHPGVIINAAYGASGSLVTQIVQGAPFDLFLAADTVYPTALAKAGKVDGDIFPYSVGHIVVWVPNNSKLDLRKGLELLLAPEVKKVAIANPAHAPYGRAAEEALKKLGLYDKLSSKIVMGENVAQTAQFAESKAADVGIVALSLALSPALKTQGRYAAIDSATYSPMVQSGAVLKGSKHLQEAREFRDYLLGKSGQAILASFGLGAGLGSGPGAGSGSSQSQVETSLAGAAK